MIPRLMCFLACLSTLANAAIYNRDRNGSPVKRPDFASVQFYLNQDFAPGFTNSDGNVVITPDSDVMGSLNAAIATWNSITTSAAQIAPIQSTTQTNQQNIILMADTPAIRSSLGPSLNALTAIAVSGTTILYSTITFNPVQTFSSTGAPKTFDLQATFTKQLGNAFGLANSGAIGSALFIFSSPQELSKQTLSPDDITGMSFLYPSATESNSYGTVGGTLTLNGAPLRNALVSAVDPVSGAGIVALTKPTDGTWSAAAPPGNYLVYAQPLVRDPNQFGEVIMPGFIGANDGSPIDTNFQGTFIGGDGSGTMISVTAGAATDVSFSPDPPNGATQTSLLTINAVPVGGNAPLTLSITPGPVSIVSGRSYDLIVQGTGIDSTIGDANIQLLGPVTLRPGTTKQDKTPALNFNGVDYPNVRFTVDVPAVSTQSYGTLIITNNGNFASLTTGIVIAPSQ